MMDRGIQGALIGAMVIVATVPGAVSAAPAAAAAAPEAVAARTVALGAVAPAQRWRLNRLSGIPGNDELDAVVTTGRRSAWAVGSIKRNGTYRPLVQRWNGERWRSVAAPAMPDTALFGIDATSDSNVWAFGVDLKVAGGPLKSAHWNGKRWRVTTIDQDAPVFDTDVVGPRNVWLAGDFGNDRTLKHFDGTRWRDHFVGGQVQGLHMTSARAGWAVGMSNRKAFVLRWNGRRWIRTAVPAIPAPAGAEVSLSGVRAYSPRNVWAVGTITWMVEDDEEHRPVALHWNGSRWRRVAVPALRYGLGPLTPDGRGGFWSVGGNWYNLVHYNAGRWTSVVRPGLPGGDSYVQGMALIPGTARLLGVGHFVRWGAPEDDNSDAAYFSAR